MPVKKIAIAAVLGGIAFFLWGAISHTVLPFANNAFLQFTNEEAITQAILSHAPASGMYFLPWVPHSPEGMTEEEFKAAKKKAEDQLMNGPFILASVRLGPMGSFPNYLLIQLFTDMLTALAVCFVLLNTREMSFWNQVFTIEWIGLAGFAALSLPQWNWYAFSTAFTLAEMLDIVVGFFLAGMVIVKVLGGTGKPKPTEQAM